LCSKVNDLPVRHSLEIKNAERTSALDSKDDTSLEAASNEASSNALILMLNSYFNHSPLTDGAFANVKISNGHPNRGVCESRQIFWSASSAKALICAGLKTVASVPPVFPNDVGRSGQPTNLRSN
jgi:hypothetical protein